jgi:hypothetical protein
MVEDYDEEFDNASHKPSRPLAVSKSAAGPAMTTGIEKMTSIDAPTASV